MPAICLRGVSKAFRRRTEPGAKTLKSYLLRDLWRPRPRGGSGQLWALQDVDLTVEKGATVAILGRNGSGKSTLLHIIGGMLKPTTGTVRVEGRASALISLGAGFHPELTGRENVLVDGMLLGLSKREVRERFDAIVRFAELEDFIDEPVRTYSTGMYMRLGFSVAVHLDPDILLIDEVLAVGDLPFVEKCRERMDEFKKRGKTIVLVTHDLETARTWCDHAVWMHQGRVSAAGDPSTVVSEYCRGMGSAVPLAAGPQIVAVAVTPGNEDIVWIPEATGTAAFLVATMNVGAEGLLTVSAETGGARLPISLTICPIEPVTGAWLAPPAPAVTLHVDRRGTPTLGVFVRGLGRVPFDPATHRIHIRFVDEGQVNRGATSVGVATLPAS
jgi:ABC-type polysaccharide/polyol phosphate transport system ATPase subunit